MALLLALAGLRHELGVQLHAAHFNHKLRPQAGRDERFVSHWCRQLNIPLTVGRRPGRKIRHLSEDDARQMRFKFFVKTARCLKAQSVALAHTRNDLAETVLMRLMRGSGLYGLRAILPRRSIEGIMFVRPLIGSTRRDVEGYLKAQKVPFCTDATNRLTVYERNKVRLELLPLLVKEYNPQITDALSDLAVTAGEDYEFLAMHARKHFKKVVNISDKKVKMDLKKIQRQHPAILRLMFRLMAESLTGDPAALTFENIHALENLAAAGHHGTVDLPHHLKAQKTQKFLEIYYA
jgi:tRNA(Ile)-lysidine synthase